MKTIAFITFAGISLMALNAPAATFTEAKVTEIVKEVSLLRPPSYVAKASIGDKVAGQTTVRTGIKSRTELTFPDESLLRLGSNTQFSFAAGERDFNLTRGTAVLKTSKKSGGARIHAGAVTAAITGSMAAVLKPPPGEAGFFKLLLFFGTAHITIDGKKYHLKPSQLAMVEVDENGKVIGKVQILFFDAALCASTSNLMNPNEPGLKENLARLKKALEEGNVEIKTGDSPPPVPGQSQGSPGPDNILKKLFGIFRSGDPECMEGYFFDKDFQECFPGNCPEGSTFDPGLQQCVPDGRIDPK